MKKEKYSVEASGTRLVLKKFFKEADKFISINEPKTVLRKIFGNLGVSPLFLKTVAGKKQIEWFKETFGTDEEATRKEKKIIENIDLVFNQRRDVNRDIKNIKVRLHLNHCIRTMKNLWNVLKNRSAPKKKKPPTMNWRKKILNTKNQKKRLKHLPAINKTPKPK